jgi:hypothetical protein
MRAIWRVRDGGLGHYGDVQDKLGTLAAQLDAIIRRIRTLGLTRAADDLLRVSLELRRLGHASAAAVVDPTVESGRAP